MGSGYFPDRHILSFFGQNVDFQPARDCPRNFIIFDRTGDRSQIMYNPGLNLETTPMQKDDNAPGVMNEDLADIDALLSFEDDEDEYNDDDDVSTGRTSGYDGGDTSDSCSSRLRNSGPGVLSGHHELKNSERKRDKMRKMVKSLKGIVPGVTGGMNTVAVLDEAVKYLKTLKVEAEKMGVGDFQG